eukprot:5647133-Amphidinium_carterae.1
MDPSCVVPTAVETKIIKFPIFLYLLNWILQINGASTERSQQPNEFIKTFLPVSRQCFRLIPQSVPMDAKKGLPHPLV